VIGRWNAQGEAGIRDHCHEIDVSRPLLSPELQQELTAAQQAPPAAVGLWSGPKVAQWMRASVRSSRGSATRVGVSAAAGSQQSCASPQHAKADEASLQEFKKTSGTGGSGTAPALPSRRPAVGDG
jgi:hypothetical protein